MLQFGTLELIASAAGIPFPAWIKLMLSLRGFDMGPPANGQAEATRRRIDEQRPAVAAKLESLLALARTSAAG